jgi:hypothetical protein
MKNNAKLSVLSIEYRILVKSYLQSGLALGML